MVRTVASGHDLNRRISNPTADSRTCAQQQGKKTTGAQGDILLDGFTDGAEQDPILPTFWSPVKEWKEHWPNTWVYTNIFWLISR